MSKQSSKAFIHHSGSGNPDSITLPADTPLVYQYPPHVLYERYAAAKAMAAKNVAPKPALPGATPPTLAEPAPSAELKDFVKGAVTQMEIGENGDKYKPVFSTEESGLSFGGFQHDVRKNATARKAFGAMLDRAVDRKEITADDKTRLMTLARSDAADRVSSPPTKNEKQQLSDILKTETKEIDQLDRNQADKVSLEVQTAIDAVKDHQGGAGALKADSLDPEAVTLLGSWSNRTNGLTQTIEKLKQTNGEITLSRIQEVVKDNTQLKPESEGGKGEDFDKYEDRAKKAGAAHKDKLKAKKTGLDHTNGGVVEVAAYTRGDGTEVHAYQRNPPTRQS